MLKIWTAIQNLRNAVDFFIRRKLRWQRRGIYFKNQDKTNLFDYLELEQQKPAEDLAKRFIEQYHLKYFYDHATKINFRENLYYLSMIENAFNSTNPNFGDTIRAADIGPAHWFYVQAYFASLTWWNRSQPRLVDLTGYEVDAYRLFSNFYSSYDYAQAHIRDLPVRYLPQAFSSQPNKFDLITLFFPFVFVKDHQDWGLPGKIFDPISLRQEVRNSLKADGIVLIVNQGLDEHKQEIKYLTTCNFKILETFEQSDLLYRYDLKRFVIVAGINDEF